MRAEHDPLATAATCPGCKIDPDGFDHEAVLRLRPSDFDHQVVKEVRGGLKTGEIAGVTLGPASPSMARRYLIKIDAEPRPARKARAA